MTAQIIPFRRPKAAAPIIAEPAMVALRAVPEPANVFTVDAVPVSDQPGSGTIVGATMALSAACRDMAESLAVLVAHCESADSVMAEISEGARAIAAGGDLVRQAARGVPTDIARAVQTLAVAAGSVSKN